jgi:hypothetical protein
MNNVYLLVYGIPSAMSVAAALLLSALCWLVEMLVRRRIGVYAGYAAIWAAILLTFRLLYGNVADCSGVFGWPFLFPQCEWSSVTWSLAVFLTIITVPLLVVSEVKLSRWSLNRGTSAH